MTGILGAMDTDELAAAAHQRRLDRGWSVEEAARRAGINRVTYKRIEDGLPVQDVKRRAVEEALGLDAPVRPHLGQGDAGEVARMVAPDLNPDLADFTDQELLHELEGRMLLLASRMSEVSGADLLAVTVGEDGVRRLVSHATKRTAG